LKTRTKKCFNCKEEFAPFSTLQKFCLKNECIKAMVETQKLKEWNKKKKKLVENLKTANDYLKIAQQVFNKFIRVRDAGLNCISCNKPIIGVKHASHYLSSGGHSAVRFNENNVWVSCYKCNVMLSGNLIQYRKRLIVKIGIEKVEWLEEFGNREKKWSKDELKLLIKQYKEKINELNK
jgi:hypothetical protein